MKLKDMLIQLNNVFETSLCFRLVFLFLFMSFLIGFFKRFLLGVLVEMSNKINYDLDEYENCDFCELNKRGYCSKERQKELNYHCDGFLNILDD